MISCLDSAKKNEIHRKNVYAAEKCLFFIFTISVFFDAGHAKQLLLRIGSQNYLNMILTLERPITRKVVKVVSRYRIAERKTMSMIDYWGDKKDRYILPEKITNRLNNSAVKKYSNGLTTSLNPAKHTCLNRV